MNFPMTKTSNKNQTNNLQDNQQNNLLNLNQICLEKNSKPLVLVMWLIKVDNNKNYNRIIPSHNNTNKITQIKNHNNINKTHNHNHINNNQIKNTIIIRATTTMIITKREVTINNINKATKEGFQVN